MKKVLVAVALCLGVQSVYAFGLFPHGSGSSNRSAPTRTQTLMVSPVPEPETYLMLLVGLGAVGWIAMRRKK